MSKIEIKDLSYIHQTMEKEIETLKHISFSVEEKSFCSILGPSGCGKSTLLSIIAGLLPINEGNIIIHSETSASEITKVGLMPQESQLFDWYNIWDNVTIGLKICHRYNSENIKKVEELLKKYGLYEFRKMRACELSGGMQQRCSLIRTLAVDPEVLLLDEPFSALDYQTRIKVSEDIQNIIKEHGETAILVTHDIPEAISLSDRIVILSKRPAEVVDVLDLSDFKDIKPSDRRNTQAFQEIYNRIWNKISDKHEWGLNGK